MVKTKSATAVTLLFILIWACSDNTILYQKNFRLADTGWEADHVLKGSWTPDESLRPGNFVLNITHDSDFGYQNIYLTGTIEQDNRNIWSDTFFIQLAESKSGRWLGRKKGNQYIQSYLLPIKIDSLSVLPIQYQFGQFSRDSILQGVSDVEFEVVRSY